MKKHIIIFCTALSIVLAGCNKPVLAPNGPASSAPEMESKIAESNATESKKEFSEKLRIYDKSEKYYVDLEISSPNETVMKEAVAKMQGTNIELMDKLTPQPQMVKARDNNTTPLTETAPQENGLNIKILHVEKGTSPGFKIHFDFSTTQTENLAARTNTLIVGAGETTVFLDFIGSYQVQNLGELSYFRDYYTHTGPFWTLRDDEFLNRYDTYIFAPGFSSYRQVVVRRATAPNAGVVFDVTILS